MFTELTDTSQLETSTRLNILQLQVDRPTTAVFLQRNALNQRGADEDVGLLVQVFEVVVNIHVVAVVVVLISCCDHVCNELLFK